MFVAATTGCGEADVSGLDGSVPDGAPTCLDVCRAAETELEQTFGVTAPCTEPEWSERASSCEVCGPLFERFYSVVYEWDVCRDCRNDARPTPTCGTPAPECSFGTRQQMTNCEETMCGECGPTYTGACEACPPEPG